METHAHDLHKAPGHGWKHYFFEFFMLFLAVSCGFIAENIRESFAEHPGEKEYMQSLVKDLEYDTTQFNFYNNLLKEKTPFFDSVFSFLDDPAAFNYKLLASNFIRVNSEIFYRPVEPTILQLKNSGNLRLIENKKVPDSILVYDSWIIGPFKDINNSVIEFEKRIYQLSEKMYDYHAFNQLTDSDPLSKASLTTSHIILVSKDKAQLPEMYNMTFSFKVTNTILSEVLDESKKKATNLIVFIKKEYHLESE
jgi:hypothetical protein